MRIINFVLISLIFIFPGTIFAQESIESFDLLMRPSSSGVISVVETIDYSFGSIEKHGIYRYIPLSSAVGELYLISEIEPEAVLRDGNKEKYEESESNSTINFKIGDPDKTINGTHKYEIYYTIKNQIRNYSDHDEIYWNVTGFDWPADIKKATATIDSGIPITQVKCFTGVSGSTEENCIAETQDGKATFSANSNLFLGEGLTIVASFPANSFPKSEYSEKAPGELSDFQKGLIAAGLGFYYLILPPGVLAWYLKYKRKDRFGKVGVNFDLPIDQEGERIPPAEAGIIDNAKLEKDDVIATIFDLAIRKLIKIEEVKGKKVLGIFGGENDYKITKFKELEGGTSYEKELFERLFKSGSSVNLSSLKEDFYKTFEDMEKSVFSTLIKRGFYTKNPKTQRGALLAFGIISLITLNLFLGGILIYLSRKLNGRTQEGDLRDFQVDGLKVFLKNMKRHYKFQVDSLITVEKYIPYAIALGYINEFMDQLKVVYPDYKPSWYSGGNFYHGYNGFYSSAVTSVTTVSPSSSSSGFSGGSSGGGGGGGGGGSW